MSLPLAQTTTDNLDEHSRISSLSKKHKRWCLVLLYSAITVSGIIGFPLLQRLYYTHGGSSKWLGSLLQSVGFVTLIFPLSFVFLKSLSDENAALFMDPKLTLSSASLGILFGIDGFLYSTGYSALPVSTSSLLQSTQLGFTALFAFILVRQKITFYSLNSVVVATCGVVVLALHTSGDHPVGESRNQYLIGFFSTLVGAAVQGLVYPLVELCYKKSSNPMSLLMVMQFQFVNGLFSSLFCIAGMLISKDYKMIAKEAGEFSLGEKKYCILLVSIAVVTQLNAIGAMCLISCTSSFFTGILGAVTLPMIEVASIITFGDKFNGQKGLSLSLCLWGFASYFFGEHKNISRTEPVSEINGVNLVIDRNEAIKDPIHETAELDSVSVNEDHRNGAIPLRSLC